jgi:hypothetical protein
MPKTGGRVKGTPNKFTQDVREVVRAAFDKLGGEKYLVKVGRKSPAVFMTAFNKLIPTAIEGSVTINHEDALRALDEGEPDGTETQEG